MDQKCQKTLLTLTCQFIQIHISSALQLRFSIEVSVDSFLLKRDYSLLFIEKNFLQFRIGILIEQKCHKCYSYWLISMFQLVLLVNYRFEFLYEGLKWQWYIFRCFWEGTICDCVPSIDILMVWKCKRVHLIFVFPRSSYSELSEATGLNSSEKVCLKTLLSITGFFLEVIWCVFDRFFLRPIDGKYRSATVLLFSNPQNNK